MNDLTEAQPKARWFKAVLFAGMLLFAFYASTHMVAAGDTWVAMACGRHFDNHGVDTVEPFSFNSHPAGPSDEQLEKFWSWTRPIIKKIHPTGWLNQNWLTHLGFYKLATWFGDGDSFNFNALVYWKFALYFLTVFCVYGIGKTLGANDTLAAAAACLAMIVGRTFYDIRPAGYSNLLVPAFVLILALSICKHYRWVWLVVPLIVFWADVHGGYIYAFIMFVPFIGVNLLLKLPKRWALGLGLCGLWLLLYLISHKFITGHKSMIDQFFAQVQASQSWTQAQTDRMIDRTTQYVFGSGNNPDEVSLIFNKYFWIWVILAVIALTLTSIRKIKAGVFYFFLFVIGGVFVISLIPRFIVNTPDNSEHLEKILSSAASSSLLSFCFVAMVGALLIAAMSFKKETFKSLSGRGLCHTVGAAATALLAMIVFNPFHLTNITHTFEISLSKHAESWRQVNEWKPAFNWMDKTTDVPNPVGEEEAFAVVLVLTLVIFTVWLVSYFLNLGPNDNGGSRKRRQQTEAPAGFRPQINIAIIVLAFLTIYMAIRSRRFIPLAGAVAPPVLAVFIMQIWQMLSARFNPQTTDTATPWSIPPFCQSIIRRVIVLALAFLGIFWGLKYKRIYLDPCPSDHQYNTIFMRMTASHLKPTDACTFLRDNNISGKMFNYWTEGGAVAFGQTPDPETGQIPLKLFMDGRAQAAYNHDKFKLWQQLFSGGPEGVKTAIAQRQLDLLKKRKQTGSDAYKKQAKAYDDALKESGRWINTELAERDVWVVLMPLSQEDSTFVKALKTTGSWKTAYYDDYQHLLVNNETPQGKTLIQNILNGQAAFPSDYAKNMTTYLAIIENKAADQYKNLYTLVSDAFKEFPSPSAAIAMLNLRRYPPYKQKVLDDAHRYIDDFAKNRQTYRTQDGYYQRLASAGMLAKTLFRNQYTALLTEIDTESESIKDRTVW